jgi:CHASE3 domain sensor protein
MHAHAITLHSRKRSPNVKSDALFYSTFVFTLAVLLTMGWLCYRSQTIVEGAELWEAHTHIVITELSQSLSSLKDAETAQRGYIITGRQEDLDPYASSLTKIDPYLNALRHLTADNALQQQRLAVITPLVAAKIAELKETIEVRTTGGIESA